MISLTILRGRCSRLIAGSIFEMAVDPVLFTGGGVYGTWDRRAWFGLWDK